MTPESSPFFGVGVHAGCISRLFKGACSSRPVLFGYCDNSNATSGLCKLRESVQAFYSAFYNNWHDVQAKDYSKDKHNASNSQCLQVPPLYSTVLHARLQRIFHLRLHREIGNILKVKRTLFPQPAFVLDYNLPETLA